ncbi:MAG: hypothetical protein M3Q07_20655 [Pseudobdellovibrionaceae bacterium]|nr:hypothetical protein [Pseudobdellovibrionaceae bacterium]
MRCIAVMRERYGFTATECLEMPYADFDRWLCALIDDDKEEKSDSEESWEAVNG